MPEEQEMYELVCKDRFTKIDGKLDGIVDMLSANPSGLIPRMAVIEEQTKANTSRWKKVFGAIVALAVAVIGKFVYGFWDKQ